MDAHQIEHLISQMTLEEKASLCSGADSWKTRAIDRLGIPSMRVTDGPHGVRRATEDDRANEPAISYPTAVTLASSWNVDLMKRVGAALGEETKSKGCDILLGPAVNIHRAPLCGRNFEYLSEDPHLAARMAVAYIQGLQSQGAGTSLKHYAANNAEFERNSMNSVVDERALREIYLPAFEAAVKEAQPWTVMCSYNKINGAWASENHTLLTDILKNEWGFEGLVISDWGAVHHRINTANAGLDLEMPGMGDLPIQILVNAVKQGAVSEATLNEMVRRILRVVYLARADGTKERKFDRDGGNTPAHRALAREAGGEGIVLLKNRDDVLPIDPAKVHTLAVFGPNAAVARIEGGGSANVTPYYTVSPLEAIRARVGDQIKVEYMQGCQNTVTPPPLTSALLASDGFTVDFFKSSDFSGQPLLTEKLQALTLDGRDLPTEIRNEVRSMRWHGTFQAPITGEYTFSLTGGARCRMLLDGKVAVDMWNGDDIYALINTWPFLPRAAQISMQAGKTYDLVVEMEGANRLNLGIIPATGETPEQLSQMAARADLALVFVGNTWEHESEGADRPAWDLPGKQVDLIRQVAGANPRTVVVLNNGGVVEAASWIEQAAGLVEAGFTGVELGNAIADVLFGDVTPSGKLPDSWSLRFEDNSSFLNFPGENGQLRYGESIYVGYRYYDARKMDVLFPFGFGLSYTTFEYKNARLSAAQWNGEGSLCVSVDVTNTGKRAGKEVVQIYVADPQSSLVRPPKELKGFAKVALHPGETKTVEISLNQRDLSYYDPAVKGWVAEPGQFQVMIGASSRDIRATLEFTLTGEPSAKPKLNANSSLAELSADPQALAVLQKYVPELVAQPQFREMGWVNLAWAAQAFMELISPEKFQTILAELAKIK